MSHQNARYLKLKGKTFYFSRRVPKPLQSVTSVNRIEVCLHTRSRPYAERQALLLCCHRAWTLNSNLKALGGLRLSKQAHGDQLAIY